MVTALLHRFHFLGPKAIALYSHFFKALVTATDVSEDMVAMANKVTGDVSNMTTMVADAQNLETFEESSMDVVCI